MKDIGKKLMDIARWYSMPADHFNTIKEAVELLEQKSSYTSIKTELNDDAISRQAVLDGLASIAKAKAKSDAQKSMMGRTMFFVEQLPSVSTEKTGRWIPVSERLPEEGEDVLVWYEYFRWGDYNRIFSTYGIGYQYDGMWSVIQGGMKQNVFAWMPLPQPYKGESEDEK